MTRIREEEEEVTDEQTNEQTEGHCHCTTPSLYGSSLTVLSFVDDHNGDGIQPNDDESREKRCQVSPYFETDDSMYHF